MFNSKKYNEVLHIVVKSKSFQGKNVKTKGDLQMILSELLFVSPETVKSWGRSTSTGPKEDETVDKLEGLLGLPNGALGRREKMEKEKMYPKAHHITDLNKNAIFTCYSLMTDYLHSDSIEDEDEFCKMANEIEKYKPCIPQEIFSDINGFVDEELAPIVYENDRVFEACYADDLGTFDEESGIFYIDDEENLKKQLIRHFDIIFGINEKLEKFGMEKLYPILNS